MTHPKQKKYFDKVAQWLCDDTQYCVNPMIIGCMENSILLYFPFVNSNDDGFYLNVLDEKFIWCGPEVHKVCFASLFSIYVKETYGVHKKECKQLWDVYRNELKRQWGVQ